ncbi:unnamed protein product [Coregonus sp. 'balchen']|nr:unnamed protein product [Coregonus sp. 'balchen']
MLTWLSSLLCSSLSLFLLVIAKAYLEAQGIWEPFKRSLSLDSAMETGRPFHLREIVFISSDANLNDFTDTHQKSTRGMYGSGSGVSRAGGQNSRSSMDLDRQRARMGFGRSTIQASSTSSSSSSQLANGAPVSCQLTNRKARSSKGQQGGGRLDLQDGGPGSGSSLPHRRLCSGGEDPDYASLLGAMDNDLDRPESPLQALQDHNGSPRAKGKPPPGDQLNDDSSSTTTETSNPEVEASNKEEPVKKKGRTAVEKEETSFLTKPQNNKKQTNTEDKSSSLELPYATPLENKQRKTFTSKALIHPALTTGPRTLQKPRPESLSHLNSSDCSGLVPCGKLEDCCPFPLVKRLSNGSVSTVNPFLKRPISARTYSPPPSSPSLVTRGTYSQVLNANCETNLKKAPGNKLANATTSLPGKNGNPTFAAVAAGYDRSPGFNSVNSFSAFGPNNSFNLTGVFRGMSFPKTSEPQQSWPELSSVSSSIWDAPSTSNPLHSWLSSSSSPTVPTASILGRSRNHWSTTTLPDLPSSTPFGSSIWSTGGALHSFTPTTTSTLPDLPSSTPALGLAPAPPAAPTEMTYNPWSTWRPTLSRRSSEPWPNQSDDTNH